MFPTKASDTTSQPQSAAPAPPPAVGVTELIVSGGLRKVIYTDPVTGQRRLEPEGIAYGCLVLFVAVVFGWAFFKDPDAFLEVLPLFGILFLLLSGLAICPLLPVMVSLSPDNFTASFLLAMGPFKLELCKEKHSWSTLECVRFQKAEAASSTAVARQGRGDCLVFDWRGESGWLKSNQAVMVNTSFINISGLTQAQREDLFTVLSRLVPQEVLSPEVLYLQLKTLSGATSEDSSAYTQVWLEEYNRHFEISNYVPLTAGSNCGDGRFTISMIIAARINSSTYLAVRAGGDRVIVKELVAPIDSDDAMQKKLLEQFNREAATLAMLNHPSIVRVIDHFIENGRSYIVMEQALGQNIREYVRLQGCLPEPTVVQIAAQLASVLHYLHHHTPSILHRDFTPDNLIYGQDGSVTVIDFGAANVYNTGKTATLIGKQGYMPPEQLRGKPSPASDIYAFGATLSFLLSGRDLPAMGTLPSFEGAAVSAELLSLLQNCICLSSEDRPSCDQIIQVLDAIKRPAPSLLTQ